MIRRHTLPTLTIAILCCAASAQDAAGANAKAPAFVNLIRGAKSAVATLDAFEQKGGKAIYRLDEDCVVGTCVPQTPNSFLCTKKHYGDFVFEYEFRVDDSLNSGVQIRSHSLPDYRNGRVHGYQVEIDPSKRAWTAGIYDEARRGWLADLADNEPARKAFKPGVWNQVRVVAEGDSIKTWLNGVAAADLVDSMTVSGFIGLQVHGVGKRTDKLEVRWRNLHVQDNGHHVWQPIWNGTTLDGWQPEGGGKWSIENGAIVARNQASQAPHGHLFFATPQKDFTIRLKYRAVQGNSGLYFRAEKRDGNIGIAGMQAEIDVTKNPGGLYETGGRAWLVQPDAKSVKKFFRPGKWNDMTVSAHGERLVIHVNGHKTAGLRDTQGRKSGWIALQVHGGQDVEIHFKDIELLVKADR